MGFHGFDLFKATDVDNLYRHWFRSFYNNASKLVQIQNLDESIDENFVMSQLLLSGRIAVFKNEGKIYMLNCNVGGAVNEYYKPTKVLIANPTLGSFELSRDFDAAVVHLTPMDVLREYPKTSPMYAPEGGIYSLIAMCANLMADNISSINSAQINARVHAVFTAESDDAAEAAKLVLKDIYSGKPYSVVTSELLKRFSVNPISNSGTSKELIELLEVCQYIISMFWNNLGIDSNYNMKRERLITAEVDKNLMSLKVPIETILETLNSDFNIVNNLFGTEYHAIMNPEFEMVSTPEDTPEEKEDKNGENDGDGNTDENNRGNVE